MKGLEAVGIIRFEDHPGANTADEIILSQCNECGSLYIDGLYCRLCSLREEFELFSRSIRRA